MFTELREILLSNPNAKEELPKISIQVCSDTNQTDEIPSTLCGWIPTPLEPPGPVSAILWKTNPEFRASTIPVRKTILRETILKLQERVEAELRGHRWSRSKIIEQLAAQQSADASPPQNTRELNNALAFLFEVQFVFVDEANKKITLSPEDVRTWSSEKPIWGLSVGSRAVFHRRGEESVAVNLGKWVSDREHESWKITYPVAEGTLESIKAKLSTLNVGMGTRIEKPKKADYAAVLGRAEALRALEKLGAPRAEEEVVA